MHNKIVKKSTVKKKDDKVKNIKYKLILLTNKILYAYKSKGCGKRRNAQKYSDTNNYIKMKTKTFQSYVVAN